MAIAVDAFNASVGTASTGDFTPTLSTHTTDDLLVIVTFCSRDCGSESNTLTDATASWSAVAATVGVASSFNREGIFRVFYKKATSASETPPDISCEFTATKTYFCACYTISGFADPAALVQNTATGNPTPDVNASIPSVTVNENQSLIIIGALKTNDGRGTDTLPTGFTSRYDGDPNTEFSVYIADDILNSYSGEDWANTWDTAGGESEITFALSIEPSAGGASVADVNFHGTNRGILRGVNRGIG